MFLIRELEGRWVAEVEITKPLEFGLLVVVQPGDVVFLTKGFARPAADMVCQVAYWRSYMHMEICVDDVTVQLVRHGERLMPRLTRTAYWVRGRRYWLASYFRRQELSNLSILMAMLCIASLFVLGWMVLHRPDVVWAWAGRCIRAAGSLVVLVLFVHVIPSRLGVRKRSGFLANFYFALLLYTGLAVWAAWLQFARLPETFSGSTQEYAAFAKDIGGRLSHTYWPILLAALPWAGLILRTMGFEVAGKTAEDVRKAAKD